MIPPYKTQFDLIETERIQLMRQLSNYSVQQLHFFPKDKWSILQIIAHLITAERLSIMYMKKKIQGIDNASDSGVWEEVKMALLIISQRLPLKFKAPQVVVQQTTQVTTLQQLEEEWNQVRQELNQLLEKIPPQHRKRKIYKHVVLGKLNAQQALRFFHEHFVHHQPQINRLLSQ
ncbi:MAG: DinB family protein [Flammeovirgaceae bacterium]